MEELERDIKFETPTIMGIDELKLMGTYRCVITNLGVIVKSGVWHSGRFLC